MNNKGFKYSIALVIMLFISQAYSGEKITGAFGIQFGTLLKDVKVIKSHVNNKVHNVEAPKPMDLLRFYAVDTTGANQKIYRITGISLQNNKLACLEDLSTITAILADKYGKSKQLKGMFRYQDGDRSVIASCDLEGGNNSRKTYKLKVTYEDRSLMAGSEAL